MRTRAALPTVVQPGARSRRTLGSYLHATCSLLTGMPSVYYAVLRARRGCLVLDGVTRPARAALAGRVTHVFSLQEEFLCSNLHKLRYLT